MRFGKGHHMRSNGGMGTLCRAALILAFIQPAFPQANELASLSDSIEALSRRVNRAVVQVFSTGYALADEETGGGIPAGLITKQRSSGSGVVLSADGYIVTNNHVVQNARRVRVQLPPAPGGRGRLLEATVVGTDREADLAVLRVDAGEPLQAAVRHFAECIRDGTVPISDGNLGLRVVKQLEAATRSIRAQGGRVILANGKNGNGQDARAVRSEQLPAGVLEREAWTGREAVWLREPVRLRNRR